MVVKVIVVLSRPPAVSTRVDLPNVAVSPLDGLAVSATLPTKLLRLIAAIVVEHAPPIVQFSMTALEGCIAKSVT